MVVATCLKQSLMDRSHTVMSEIDSKDCKSSVSSPGSARHRWNSPSSDTACKGDAGVHDVGGRGKFLRLGLGF